MGTKRALNYEEFDLHKLKNSGGNLQIVYFEKSGTKDSITVDSENTPHPDLTDALAALSPYCAHILQLQKGWDYAREELRENPDKLTGAVNGAKEADKLIKVSGISLSGEGQNASVKITGSLKCLNGAMGFATPLVRFANSAMAIEQTIEGLCEKVRAEAYNFIFKGKVADPKLDIEGEDPQLDIETEAGKVIDMGISSADQNEAGQKAKTAKVK